MIMPNAKIGTAYGLRKHYGESFFGTHDFSLVRITCAYFSETVPVAHDFVSILPYVKGDKFSVPLQERLCLNVSPENKSIGAQDIPLMLLEVLDKRRFLQLRCL